MFDHQTGETVYTDVAPTFTLAAGKLQAQKSDRSCSPQSINLPRDRFAWHPADPWKEAQDEAVQNPGTQIRIVGGQLITSDPNQPKAQTIDLPRDRFASVTRQEFNEIRRLGEAGATRFIELLEPTQQGFHLRTQPTQWGDVLEVFIEHEPATDLYHAHLWRFWKNTDGQLSLMDLSQWAAATPNITGHNIHLYSHTINGMHTLCLSRKTQGGLPRLSGCVLQAAKWASGMGYVIRGKHFPYNR
jgi:hypothetical protein